MIRALQDEQGPHPGLKPVDCRPGPQPKPDFKEDPYSDAELGFFEPTLGAQPSRSLQRRTPPPPPPPLPEISQSLFSYRKSPSP
eukprot:12430445-Alexandrium_andersonii.AAC.1